MRKGLLVATAMMVATAAHARQPAEPLEDPPGLAVPAGLNTKDVERSIAAAGPRHGWLLTAARPGTISFQYSPRGFVVDVDVTYGAEMVQIHYLDSTDLEYREERGVRYIHPNYNRWAKTLARDIEVEMAARTVSK